MIFKDNSHQAFYQAYLESDRNQDVYHKALMYCLGINSDTRKHINDIYDFKEGHILISCLTEPWQTSGSMNVVRMAFSLYSDGTPSLYSCNTEEEQLKECRRYTVNNLFCCNYAPYFCQAVQLRYPEYFKQNQYEFSEKSEVKHTVVKNKIYKKK